MSKFSLEAVLSLTDNLTSPYKKSAGKITAVNQRLMKSFKTLATIGVGGLVTATGLAGREFIRLDESITQAGAKFKDLTVDKKALLG